MTATQPQFPDGRAMPRYATTVAVAPGSDDEQLVCRARRLAEQLQLPIAEPGGGHRDLLLVVAPHRLELRLGDSPRTRPIHVDFVKGPFGYRRRTGSSCMLHRAVGPPDGSGVVVDATAGFGRDAFLLALRGWSVIAVERHPIVAALLADGLSRAAAFDELRCVAAERLALRVADAREVLESMRRTNPPEVVYLDPMYPLRKKSAQVRMEMRALRRLVGDDGDAGELLEVARATARRRVVVKRMRHAPVLAPGVSHTLRERTIRFDVYTR